MDNHSSRKEISLRDTILTLISCKNIILKSWRFILTIGFLLGLLGILYAWMQPKIYIAQLTFATEEKVNSNNFAAIAGQFGIDMGKSEGGAFRGDNILEILTSQLVLEEALLTNVKVDGKQELLLNYYLRINDFYNPQNKDAQNITYVAGQPRSEFSRAQDSIIHIVSSGLKRNSITVDKLDKRLGIFKLEVKSTDELFAKLLCEQLSSTVYDIYINVKTKKARQNIDLLQYRLDSVKTALDEEMYLSAGEQDHNQNASRVKVKIPYMKRQLNIQFLNTMFIELTKNLELSKMNLVKEEPIIQVVDRPIPPLNFEKKSRLISGIFFGFVGVLLASLYKIMLSAYNAILRKEKFNEVY